MHLDEVAHDEPPLQDVGSLHSAIFVSVTQRVK